MGGGGGYNNTSTYREGGNNKTHAYGCILCPSVIVVSKPDHIYHHVNHRPASIVSDSVKGLYIDIPTPVVVTFEGLHLGSN